MLKKWGVVVPALLCVSVLALAGCSSKKSVETGMQTGAPQTESLESQARGVLEGRTTAPMKPVYFDFDKSNIRKDQVSRIAGNADYLKENPNIRIRIEGNTDPRGTSEYNMALGERRALAAKKDLLKRGVSEANMTTVSYGKERILIYGNDEASWAQNRRDDFVIAE
ncbi:MAG: peptidoglycan-associated lipoprotein Pal [Desulfobulbaceae bacterium]|jgi:peptidoglycan-associated lipoprotein|nr:peptidoglycan-associated lipoprotein Pal [Desulfobulbaceae bacterium]